tara:strand:+ start:1950 stop:2465 length:516 start_codon:yes stop_codon:yes gene_type:complete
VLYSCSDILSDYEKNDIYPLGVDEKICITLNGKQPINANSFINEDSLTIENLYRQHSTDTNSFISPSEEHHWSISIDSTSYFMLYASEVADSYFVALDFSSELKLYNESGNLIVPFNDIISLQNVAGCSNIRVRQVYSDLTGLYLASLYNPNVTTVNLIFINDNIRMIEDR